MGTPWHGDMNAAISASGNRDPAIHQLKLESFLCWGLVPVPRQCTNTSIAPPSRNTVFKAVGTLFEQLWVDSGSGAVFFRASYQANVLDEAHATKTPRSTKIMQS